MVTKQDAKHRTRRIRDTCLNKLSNQKKCIFQTKKHKFFFLQISKNFIKLLPNQFHSTSVPHHHRLQTSDSPTAHQLDILRRKHQKARHFYKIELLIFIVETVELFGIVSIKFEPIRLVVTIGVNVFPFFWHFVWKIRTESIIKSVIKTYRNN